MRSVPHQRLSRLTARLRKSASGALLAWTMLSEILGPGIGPGVSKDFKPLRQEEGSYRFEQRTRQEYENAERERNQQPRRNDWLFEQFYRREMNRTN
ncbi:MAG TPA: hypothetical protein VLJ37_04005 [bacterium]|nr:hypothetical protein [bacterium]